MDEFNPYVAPEAAISPAKLPIEDEEGRGVWRDGDVLVMSKHARLPSRCVKCNEPATDRLSMKLTWFPRLLWALWALSILGVIVFLILVSIERRTAKIEVPVCERHRVARRRAILISWLVIPLGIGLVLFGLAVEELELPILRGEEGTAMLILIVSGAATLLLGASIALTSARLVSARKIDKKYAWIGKVGEPYLATLAGLPAYRG